jgi:hypothetical protein
MIRLSVTNLDPIYALLITSELEIVSDIDLTLWYIRLAMSIPITTSDNDLDAASILDTASVVVRFSVKAELTPADVFAESDVNNISAALLVPV